MTDREQLLALYRVCFPEDDPQFWSWIFENLYQPENTLNIRENGRIVASLQMIPCEMQLGKDRYPAHYIYAASTLPEKQGRGLMAQLLARAEEEGRCRQHAFSVLITQEDSLLGYYARFGYEPRLCMEMMPFSYTEPAAFCNCRKAVQEDIAALDGLYRAATENMLCGYRDEAFWKRQLELFAEGVWVLETNGQITAYAFMDERGVLEAMGPEAHLLCGRIVPGEAWRSVPRKNGHPMGSIKPLTEDFRQIMEQNPCYLNLMYN